jgi:calcineurin-like phosphoesterase family protein
MKTWFTSDLHFGHKNIIGYCNRPWPDVDRMNIALTERWNETVGLGDTVYVLGDFTLHGVAERIDEHLARLHGEKHLIRGNHDSRKAVKHTKGWASVQELLDLSLDGVLLRLCHFRMADWPGPRLLLHGHSHRHQPWSGHFSYDVGVDGNGYRPVSLEEILRRPGRPEKARRSER